MSALEDIARELGEGDCPTEEIWCTFCGSPLARFMPTEVEQHKPECLWFRARALVQP